jgi:hypothetical protein
MEPIKWCDLTEKQQNEIQDAINCIGSILSCVHRESEVEKRFRDSIRKLTASDVMEPIKWCDLTEKQQNEIQDAINRIGSILSCVHRESEVEKRFRDSIRKLTASDVNDYLKALNFQQAAKPDLALRESYRAAAAVLASVNNVFSLRAVSGDAGHAEAVLQDDLVPTGAAKTLLGGNVMLRHEVRRNTLLKLGSQEKILKALEVNPDERTGPVQTVFELYLKDQGKPLGDQSAGELEASLQALLWLDGIRIPGVPSLSEARTALARAKFLQRFERLAGPQFRGRARELDRLRAFVGILEAETLMGKVAAGTGAVVSRLLNLKPKPAMTIYGPGGIGKSALVMKFFLEHIRLPEDERIPFAYLDFDSPFLNINDLSTLIMEILRQLAMEFPGMASSLPASVSPESAGIALGQTLKVLSARAQQPFLLVLDTFEEVQYGGEARAYPLWDMLASLQSTWPFIRVLISGRAPVETLRLAGQEPEKFELTGLDPDAALAILKAAGVEDEAIARALVKQVGRVPLSLLLAASLAHREHAGAKGIEKLETTTYFFLSVNDEVIQGQLYERILGHIHNKEVVKLAHPGLVLRRLNAGVIFEVLREPCELAISTTEEARDLYRELARETALVAEEGAGWLTHRPDLRRIMLDLLVRRKRKEAEQIHNLAVAYYEASGQQQSGSSDSLAEAYYHRLMLGQRWSDTTALKRPEIRASLTRSLGELPLSSQIFLAEQGYSVPQEVLDKASAAELQNHTAATIDQLLPIGGSALSQAWQVLQGTAYRGTNSPLYLAEARVLFLRREPGRALDTLDEGVRFAAEAGDETRILDLLCLKAWTLEERQKLADAEPILPHIRDYADRLNARLPQIQYRAQNLRLASLFSRTDDVQLAAAALAPLLEGLSGPEFVSIAPLLKDVFVPVTRINPQPLRTLAPVIGGCRIEPQFLEPLLPLLQQTVAHMAWKPNSELRLEDLRSGDIVSNGLRRLLEIPDEKTYGLVAEGIDAVLGFWPNRLPYLSPPTHT